MRAPIAFTLVLFVSASAAAAQAESNAPAYTTISLRLSKLKLRNADQLLSDAVGSGPVIGQELDLVDDFRVNDGPKKVWGIRGSISYGGRVKLRGGYQRARYSGIGPTPSQLVFAGYTIPGGTMMDSSARYDWFEVGVQWDFLRTQMITAGLMFEPKIVNLRVRSVGNGQEGQSGPVLPFREVEEEIVPIPALGVSFDFRPIENFGVRAEAKGIRMPLMTSLFNNIEKVETFDWEVEATVYLAPQAGLTMGYRSTQFEIELDKSGARYFETKVKLRGWFAALDLAF